MFWDGDISSEVKGLIAFDLALHADDLVGVEEVDFGFFAVGQEGVDFVVHFGGCDWLGLFGNRLGYAFWFVGESTRNLRASVGGLHLFKAGEKCGLLIGVSFEHVA